MLKKTSKNVERQRQMCIRDRQVYDIVNANQIVFTEAALKAVEEALGNE